MAVKTDEIWSADELVKHPVKELNTGGQAWDANKVYQKDTLVTEHDPSFHDQLAHKQFFSLTDNNTGNDPLIDTVNWIEDNVVKYISKDADITIGAGGIYPELQDALLDLGKIVPINGAIVYLTCLDGYVIRKNIYIIGANFSGFIIRKEKYLTNNILEVDLSSSVVDNSGQDTFAAIYLDNTASPTFQCSIRNINAGSPEVLISALGANSSLSFWGKDNQQIYIDIADITKKGIQINRNSSFSGYNVQFRNAENGLVSFGSTLSVNAVHFMAINGSGMYLASNSTAAIANASSSGMVGHCFDLSSSTASFDGGTSLWAGTGKFSVNLRHGSIARGRNFVYHNINVTPNVSTSSGLYMGT